MYKILVAVGGSGGHLFPAQAFVEGWLEHNPDASLTDIIFAGAFLSKNRYFNQEKYPFCDISSATPFGSFKKVGRSLWSLVRGLKESLQLMRRFKPHVVVGFGSFHAFPVLLAAVLLRKRLILFESNQIPGKVTRFFSRFAEVTALYLPEASSWLHGKSVLTSMPMRQPKEVISKEEARRYFELDPTKTTLLIFGGSQGAAKINRFFLDILRSHEIQNLSFQVIHLVGKEEKVVETKEAYFVAGIRASVRSFETRMDLAYKAADLAISRAGAVTLAELIAFKVPAIVIPYPYAADGHQVANAQFLQESVKGGIYFEEHTLCREVFIQELCHLLQEHSQKQESFRAALDAFETSCHRQQLYTLIRQQAYA